MFRDSNNNSKGNKSIAVLHPAIITKSKLEAAVGDMMVVQAVGHDGVKKNNNNNGSNSGGLDANCCAHASKRPLEHHMHPNHHNNNTNLARMSCRWKMYLNRLEPTMTTPCITALKRSMN